MARSWEYSRGRHIAMQFTMWCILALMLGLAGLVARKKGAAAAGLADRPEHVGFLLVRLPAGWHANVGPGDGRLVIVALEPGDGRNRGAVQISQEFFPKSPPQPLNYLADEVQVQDLHAKSIFFDDLQQPGVLAEVGPDDQEGNSASGALPPALLACTVVPVPGGGSLAVVASLERGAGLTPADREFFQRMLNAIALTPRGAAQQRQ